MRTTIVLVLVSMVILPPGCYTDKSLDEFEKRITKIRGQFDRDSDTLESNVNEELTKKQADLKETLDMKDDTEQEVEEIDIKGGNTVKHKHSKSPQVKQNECCEIGSLLASRGLRCRNHRFSRAHRHTRLRLVNATLQQLGIQITVDNRNSLYLPLRICVLRNANDVDKCCMYNENKKSNQDNKDIGYDSPSRGSAHADYDYKHFRPGIHSGHRRHFKKPHNSHSKSSRHAFRRHSHQWETWPKYRAYRAQHQTDTTSYRDRRHKLS